ncbi:bifunctional diguanylate cyclase/phosphodiesterase [Thermocrinis sp.]
MRGKFEFILFVAGFVIAAFLIAIRDYVKLDLTTFAYFIALTRIPAFFILLLLALSLTLMGPQLISKRLHTIGLFLLSALVPKLFQILSFVFFPDFITPNTRDKAAWLYITTIAFVLLALTLGVFYHRLTPIQRSPVVFAFISFLISCVISVFIILYHPYLPKTYQPGFGSTPISDFFDVAFILWVSYLTYHIFKYKTFGSRANSLIFLSFAYLAISSLLTVFYTTFTDLLIVASTIYMLIAYLLLAYAVLIVEIKETGKSVTQNLRALVSSLAKIEPIVEKGVQKFSLGEVFEKGEIKSVYIYDAKDRRLLAHFHGYKNDNQEPYQLANYSDMLGKKIGYIGNNIHFQVRDGHIIVSKGQFAPENPIMDLHIINVETLLHAYFAQYNYLTQFLQEKSKELNRLYLILETSEYATQAYNNIENFSRQVIDRLDYVIPMDGSIFYMYDKKSESVEKLVVSSDFIKNFQEEDSGVLMRNAISSSEPKGLKGSTMFVKFEQENYQAGIIGLRKEGNFQREDFMFLETVSNQLFHVVKLMKVIEDLEKAQLSIRLLSEYDPLTLLHNRRSFEKHIQENIDRSQRTKSVFSLMLIDIDNFKVINDTYGYSAGDLILKFFANLLKRNLRRLDIPSRLGGDEFAILLPSTSKHTAKIIADRIIKGIKEEPLDIDGHLVNLSISVVVLSYPSDGTSVEELMSTGELLMRDAKRHGKDLIIVSEEETKGKILTVKEFEKAMVKGFSEDSIVPYFHEIIDVQSEEPFGFEVLMRIKFDDRILTVEKFVPIAESLGLMHKLDLILVEKVLKNYWTFKDKPLFIFLNMVPANATEQFAEFIKAKADEYSVPIDRVVLEITERQAIEDILSVAKFVRELRDLGFKFAIDDFGSGYSSFYYLKYLPVDYLKIEGDFIRSVSHSSMDRMFIKCMVNLAKEMGIKTVAEFVEDDEIFQYVKELGIDYAQGYYFGKPEPLDAKIKKFFSKE